VATEEHRWKGITRIVHTDATNVLDNCSIRMVLDGRRYVLSLAQEGEAIETMGRAGELTLERVFDKGRFRVLEDAGPLPIVAGDRGAS
jgi:hypothetical protein